MRILAIADDFSGAAEVAGIAHRLGHEVELRATPDLSACTATVLVVDADTRARSVDDARQAHAALATRWLATTPQPAVFRKIDSVLRGHLTAEIDAWCAVTGQSRALLLPANPSRGRTIVGGRYLIDGVELASTAFAHDPLFPIRESRVDRLAHGNRTPITIPDIPDGDAIIRALATLADNSTLIAGAADAFAGWLARALPRPPANSRSFLRPTPLPHRLLIVNGSRIEVTAEHDLLRSAHVEIVAGSTDPLPPRAAIYLGPESPAWIAERLQRDTDLHLGLTGGTTAAAMIRQLGLSRFTVSSEPAPGVVTLLPIPPDCGPITVKPGSYPWPSAFLHPRNS